MYKVQSKILITSNNQPVSVNNTLAITSVTLGMHTNTSVAIFTTDGRQFKFNQRLGNIRNVKC